MSSTASRRAYPSPPIRLVQPGRCPRSGFLCFGVLIRRNPAARWMRAGSPSAGTVGLIATAGESQAAACDSTPDRIGCSWPLARDPVKLLSLVFGEVPGAPDKFKVIHWGAMIILRRKVARQKPGRIGHTIVGHGIACARDPHDNVVILDLDNIASRQHFIPRRVRLCSLASKCAERSQRRLRPAPFVTIIYNWATVPLPEDATRPTKLEQFRPLLSGSCSRCVADPYCRD
jgi:hypothetical protein